MRLNGDMRSLTYQECKEATVISRMPSIHDPLGIYKIITNGLYYGFWSVVRTWTGDKAVVREMAPYEHWLH